jgi:hypothetical protein
MRRTGWVLGLVALASSAGLACSSAKTSGFEDDGGVSNGTVGGGTLGGGDAGAGKVCAPAKGNYDIPGNNCDDDNDGTVDNPPTCDSALSASTGGTAEDFARAIGICATAAKDGYGLVSATFTRGYNVTQAPKPDQHGVLSKFGNVIKPREGKALGVLSTGYAEEYDGPGNAPFGGITGSGLSLKPAGKDWWNSAFNPGGSGQAPPGFPKAAAGCAQANVIHDVISLKLELKAPANANGLKFDFNFYSGEWPEFICSSFNDGFIAYLSAKGFNGGTPDNISFDSKKNPVSVNNGFFDRCTAGVKTGCSGGAKAGTSLCPSGVAELRGTGFGVDGKWCANLDSPGNDTSTNGGATGWLTSQAPVQAGETFTLELMIWDTGDGILDSSILIDNFAWAEGEVSVATDRPR